MIVPPEITSETLPNLLEHDIKVKVAGVDCDGVLRGKVMSKEKFLSIVQDGFGFSSAIFGWDMHDLLYTTKSQPGSNSTADTGYADFVAMPDLSSFRRIPWEDNIPFFLLRFSDNENRSIVGDGRGMLKSVTDKLASGGYQASAGGEANHREFNHGVNANVDQD
jgi:glutamine synthetase